LVNRTRRETRRFRRWVIGVLLLAGGWRLLMAAALPVISRDGVGFCWYARDLGVQGWSYLKAEEAAQHPLLPALILGVQRVVTTCGAADTPMTWQRCGQAVCWLAGLAVVALSGALAHRLVRRLALPVDEQLTAIMAMLLAALLDLNVWLSADVMSDEVHLAFYLGAVLLLLKLDGVRAALGCGLLAGLAFLTRPEGLLPGMAGLVVLALHVGRVRTEKLAARVLVLAAGFLVCAGPYWLATGRLSTKKDPLELFQREAAAASQAEGTPVVIGVPPSAAVQMARLETRDVGWYALVPFALVKLLRAGRVVVPLLALVPLISLRRELLRTPVRGLALCGAGHFALTVLLLQRYGYVAPRHMLVVVMLLVPLAALLLARVIHHTHQRGAHGLTALVVAAVLLPPGLYAARVPNGKDAFLRRAATWLTRHDETSGARRLLGGSSMKRVAFYAGMGWVHWPEDPRDYEAMCAHLVGLEGGYFALELESDHADRDQFERAGNRALVERLMDDPGMARLLSHVHTEAGPDGSELWLWQVAPAGR
jgi:hypothetical protein